MAAQAGAPDPEQELVELVADCYDDPVKYVMAAFPWGEPGTALEGHDGPDAWQLDQLRDIGEHVRSGESTAFRSATASGHGAGKTAVTAWIILWFMSTRPHCAGVVTANTLSQLSSKTWRELSLWHKRAINAHWFNWTATRFAAVESPETWSIAAIAWSDANPEAFAGLHAEDVLVIYDEASAISDAIWEVSEGAMTTAGAFWVTFGNPTRNTGRFRRCFGSDAHRWRTRHVDTRQCRMANQKQLQEWIDDYGEDSDFVRVRVRGTFPRASSTQLISGEDVLNARNRYADERDYKRHGALLGVDVARYGDDASVLTKRQGNKVWMPEKFRGLGTMEVAAKAYERYQQGDIRAVCVDGIGIGAGVVDRLMELGVPVIDVQSAAVAGDKRKYINVRAEIWGRMSEWMPDADLPDDDELETELTIVEYGYNSKMQIQVESKDSIKKRGFGSPDKADSLALTFVDPSEVALVLSGGASVAAKKVKNINVVW